MFALYVNGFIQMFSRFGRYADLAAAVVMIALAVLWRSPVTAALAAVSFLAYAIDLNGWVQRKSMAYAKSRLVANGSRR